MASRNGLAVQGSEIRWSEPSPRVPELEALPDEALLLASKKRQRKWIASVADDELGSQLNDLLSLTPSVWNANPGTAEFSVGSDDGTTDIELVELLNGVDWRKARRTKDTMADPVESAGDLWARKFLTTARFCNELDFVDAYLVNHMSKDTCVLGNLFSRFPEDFHGVIYLNFIRPADLVRKNDAKPWSTEALERFLVGLSSTLGHTRGRLAVRVCVDKVPGRTETFFGHDRWIHQRFDSEVGIYHALGKGLDSFLPGSSERTIIASPDASGWSARKAQIEVCVDHEITDRLNRALEAAGK